MNVAAIGIRVHSGWGALVAVTGDPSKLEVLDRQRIVIADLQLHGGKQPYHFAAQMKFPEAERYLSNCAAVSEELAFAAIRNVIQELQPRNYRLAATAVLLGSGRPLPALSEILASHALIHTAEGEFFRQAVSKACERLNLAVTGIRERDLDEQAHAIFGRVAPDVLQRIANLGKSLGPPWTEDQKKATLAASIVMKGQGRSQ